MGQSQKRGNQETQESIRIKAVKMLLKGSPSKTVAELFEVSPQAVCKWLKLYRAGGFKALKNKQRGKRKDTGRRLSEDQEWSIYRTILDKFPKEKIYCKATIPSKYTSSIRQRKHPDLIKICCINIFVNLFYERELKKYFTVIT